MFAIGDKIWPGVSKLVEECGELVTEFGKLMGSRGDQHHWSGNLVERIENEMGDVLAAVDFVLEHCWLLSKEQVQTRREKKLAIFRQWHMEDPES